jgi:3-keto-5-aminohexanoate cleavage enzyme
MAKKTWIEVALNGAWTRRLQPSIPVTAQEIITEGIACVKAGAAVVHTHTLDPETGRQNGSVENCAAFMDGIRSQVDAIVYPTAVDIPLPPDWAQRYTTTVELRKRGLLEWGVLDPGSCNFYLADASAPPLFGGDGGVYNNPNGALELGIELAAKHQFHPAYACYEPGFVRQGATLHRKQPTTPVPIYRFMFSSAFTFSFPPEEWALEAYVKLVETVAPGSPWMAAGLAVDVLPLIPKIVALGGHVRVGLEDAPFHSPRKNIELVEAAVTAIQKAGGEPATATEIRASLAAYKMPGTNAA